MSVKYSTAEVAGRPPYLQLYSLAPGPGANFDNFAGKLHAYRLGGQDSPFVLHKSM